MKRRIFVCIVCLYLVGCNTKPDPISTEFLNLKSEVIDIHDVAMAKMGDMVVLKKKLTENLDSSALDSSYIKAINDLELADEEMMTWMRGFSDAFTSDQLANGLSQTFETDEEKQIAAKALETLKLHNDLAIDMKQHIEDAISNAQLLLADSSSNE